MTRAAFDALIVGRRIVGLLAGAALSHFINLAARTPTEPYLQTSLPEESVHA